MNTNIWLFAIIMVFWLGLAIAVKVSKSTVSLFLIIPFAQIFLWLIGAVVNRFYTPWGTIAITAIHFLLLLLMFFYFCDGIRKRSKTTNAYNSISILERAFL